MALPALSLLLLVFFLQQHLSVCESEQNQSVPVFDIHGYPVQYGQDVFIFPLNSSLGGGFSLQSYHFYDYVIVTPGSLLQATAVRFGKASAILEDSVYTGTPTFIHNSLVDWNGWNIWTADVSKRRKNYIFLNNKRELSGRFTVERAGRSDGYFLKLCPSADDCKTIVGYVQGGTQWACVGSSDESMIVGFTSTRSVFYELHKDRVLM